MTEVTVGVGRIKIPYTVSSQDHELHMYVGTPTFGAGVWSLPLNPSTGGSTAWTAAAQGLADHMSEALPTGATPGTALLQEWSLTGWLTRASAAVTFPNLTGPAQLASQITLTLRAEDNTRPKIVLMDTNVVPPVHYISATGGSPELDAFIDGFLGSSLTAARPWFFMQTMHGEWLNVGSFVAVTVTYNRVLRKKRGFA